MTTEELITKTAQETVDKMQEFHHDEMKVMREYIDTRFESSERSMNERFDRIESDVSELKTDVSELKTEMTQVKSALQLLLEEFKAHREKVTALEAEVAMLRNRLDALEAKVSA